MFKKFTLLQVLVVMLCILLPLTAQASLDRIRLVITSSSDWTTLQLNGNEYIVNAIGIALRGTPDYNWGNKRINIIQPLANAMGGQSVQVQFDIILESDIEAASLAFESIKGNIGIIQIDFYHFNSITPKLVDSVKNTNTSGHPNPKAFAVNAATLLEGEMHLGFTRQQIPRLILAFYYPWYYLDSWESPVLRDTPLVPYRSDHKSAISHHVHLARQAGIDGFISSWWGPGEYSDKNLQKLLEVSKDMDFKVSIYFETLTGEPAYARPKDEILSWMRYFLQTYGQNECILHLNGKPVIFIWAPGAAPLDTWKQVFDTLRTEGLDGIYIADSLDPGCLQVFDGLHNYGPAFMTNIEESFQQISSTVKTYGWLENDPGFKIWAASAQPGYDDRSIPGRAGAVIDRANGATYTRTLEASISSDPDWILISTFNEWWEHTHVEPSKNYGNLYLELTAKYADIYKGFKPRAPVDLYIPPISDPDGTVRLSWNSPLAQTPGSYNIYRNTQPITNIQLISPLATDVKTTDYFDLPLSDGEYYYAVTAVFGGTESPPSEWLSTISSRNKSVADPAREIPVDIAIYTGSTGWISSQEANRHADILIQNVEKKVSRIEIIEADALPEWILSHTRNNQPDIILTFGDIPDSIYPSGNQQPDGSLAELFLDDGNVFLNTADYMFYGNGRNGDDGLKSMMDIPTTLWGDNTAVKVTKAGAVFTPSLRDFITHRPFHLNDLNGTDWELEASFADDGANLADPVIVHNKKTDGRIGIIYQTADDNLPRAQIISEIILNWFPTILSSPPWDVNADGRVDLNDLLLVVLHFGETIKVPVSPNPDVNRDGVVNICDLVLAGLHFGWSKNPSKLLEKV